MNYWFQLSLVSLAASLSDGAVSQAQTLPAQPPAPNTNPAQTLLPVVVTGSTDSTELIQPTQTLSGQALNAKRQTTLGETLNGLPGISSTNFGPNASRPVIRGLDGDRIKLLNNSGASQDVSAISYDHAVPIDPIAVSRIEVLRGPAALIHSGSAVGGVVNVIDNRIPNQPFQELIQRVDLGLASGDKSKSGAYLFEFGAKSWAIHADAFSRISNDTAVPINLACTQNGITRFANQICNSSATS